jgi:hypothetical protein
VDRAVLGRQLKAMKSRPERGSETPKEGQAAPRTGLRSLEEELLLVALLYPSADVYRHLKAFPWRQPECQTVWAELGTSIETGSLHLADVLSRLPISLQEWLTPIAMEQRFYREPLHALRQFIEAWQRQEEVTQLNQLRQEVDSMLEGRMPLDQHKVNVFKDLSRRLKGSSKELSL